MVTTGGGGDGEALIDWVLRAYETDPGIPHPALVVFGPFMHLDRRLEFQERAARLGKVYAITFESHFERLLERALGVVAMGGYNTFCEILSFGKPALLVPRTEPRQEQSLRAERAAQLGLVHVLPDDGLRAADGDGRAPAGAARLAGTGGRQLSGAPGRARPDRRAGGALARAAGGGARADALRLRACRGPRWPARAQGSRWSSRASHACPRPSSRRRSWASSAAAWRC